MTRTTLQVGAYGVNCSILALGASAYVVDPGSEADRIVAQLEAARLTLAGVMLTHAHFDHIGGIPALQTRFPDLPVFVHPADRAAFTHPMNCCPPDYPSIALPRNIRDVSTLDLGLPLRVIETPGHTPGGVCYYFPEEKLLLSGDTLFAGSVGRTDFPGGDMATLMHSLEALKALPPDTMVVPGHGFFTTIAEECAGNPFLQGH